MGKKKRGMSMEEKEALMYKLFLEKQVPYHFKEVEKMSMKAGIAMGSIKQVLENLVADDKVTCERIGSSKYYWIFSGDQMIKNRKLNEEITELEQTISQLESDIKQQQEGKEETDERIRLQNELDIIDQELNKNKERIDKIQSCGPVAMEKLNQQKKIQEQEQFHYLDQIQIIKSYVEKLYQGNFDEKGFNEQFGIDPEWDDL